MRIAVDVMGGDHGPAVVVEGVRLALQALPQIAEVLLVGQQAEITAARQLAGCQDRRVTIIHASEVITMEDKPREAARRKKDSSMVRAIELVRDGKAEALISPGNTGALVASATVRIGRLDPVERAPLAAVVPSANAEFILLDVGANHECTPVHLLQFAIMGSVYSRAILKRDRPRIGILSNGTEETKGTELTRAASRLCRGASLQFVGYVEGHDLFADQVDVVVTDGFVGNIVLKSIESIAKTILQTVKKELMATPVRKLGAVLARGAFRQIKQRMDPDAYGGAPLLGLNGIVIKAHGSSRERAIMNAVRVATETIQHRLNETIVREITQANERLGLAKNAVHAAAGAEA
jgi:glycerol-3-phosphate acyltransferase PlsX